MAARTSAGCRCWDGCVGVGVDVGVGGAEGDSGGGGGGGGVEGAETSDSASVASEGCRLGAVLGEASVAGERFRSSLPPATGFPAGGGSE